MCYTMDIDEIRGSLLPYLCDQPSLNALEHKIAIASKANPLGGHGFINKTPIPTHGIQINSLNVIKVAPISTFSRVNKIGTRFQFFITYVFMLIHC